VKIVLWVGVALPVFAAMEYWSRHLHGKIWHSALWAVHRSHHQKRRGRFEANDALSVLHAPIAVALILFGCMADPSWGREVAFAVGIGMTLFGFSYLVVHDGLVHERLPVGFLLRLKYFQRVRDAHLMHHTKARGRAPYGLFLGPWEKSELTHGSSPSPDAPPNARLPAPRDREPLRGKPAAASSKW